MSASCNLSSYFRRQIIISIIYTLLLLCILKFYLLSLIICSVGLFYLFLWDLLDVIHLSNWYFLWLILYLFFSKLLLLLLLLSLYNLLLIVFFNLLFWLLKLFYWILLFWGILLYLLLFLDFNCDRLCSLNSNALIAAIILFLMLNRPQWFLCNLYLRLCDLILRRNNILCIHNLNLFTRLLRYNICYLLLYLRWNLLIIYKVLMLLDLNLTSYLFFFRNYLLLLLYYIVIDFDMFLLIYI